MNGRVVFRCFLSLCSISCSISLAQDNQKGKVIVYRDSTVAALLKGNLELNGTKQTMPGYRIQIFFGADRNKANEIKTDFIRNHIETEVYMVYHQPNFKVRVGDFKTRLEALKAMQTFSVYYPNAFIVKDEIPLPKFDMQ